MKKIITVICVMCITLFTSQIYGQTKSSKMMGGKTKTEKTNTSTANKSAVNDASQKNDTIRKGHAYGREKGTTTGKEFGRKRSTASKSKEMKKNK